MRSPNLAALACAAALLVPFAGAWAAEPFPGPVAANVVRVLDGDTFLAEALVWPGQAIRVNVRIRGIDAPEMKAKCPMEKEAALRARDALGRLLAGASVSISNIAGAKYYGRVLADVAAPGGQPVAEALLAEGVVRPYAGGRREKWCG